MTGFEWLGAIPEWMGRFIPKWEVVETTVAGVKFVKGSKVVSVTPGIVWYWPIVTELKLYPTVRQPLNLPSQTLTTKDKKLVAVGGAFEYCVPDVTRLLTKTWEPDQSIRLAAAAAVYSFCTSHNYDELVMMDQDLRKKLRWEMRRRLKHLGVRVVSATLTDFAPARVIKLINASSQD